MECVFGYAAGTTGGKGGRHYVVTEPSDSMDAPAPGSLRYGLAKYSPVWITFARNMTVALQGALFLPNDTTLDGRGVAVALVGAEITVHFAQNVIIHGLTIRDVKGDHDALHIRGNTTRLVWVDHCRVMHAFRGLVDVVYGATDVTASHNYFHNHYIHNYSVSAATGNPLEDGYVMLLGEADDDRADQNLRVTVFGNWFDNSHQRQPHCRWGNCDVVNNLYTDWTYYCLGGRAYGHIRSQGNVFMPGAIKEVTPWFNGALTTPGFDDTATIVSSGDLLTGGATFHQFGEPPLFTRPYTLPVSPTPGLSDLIKATTGPPDSWAPLSW